MRVWADSRDRSTHSSDAPHEVTDCGRLTAELSELVGEQALSYPFCETCHPFARHKRRTAEAAG